MREKCERISRINSCSGIRPRLSQSTGTQWITSLQIKQNTLFPISGKCLQVQQYISKCCQPRLYSPMDAISQQQIGSISPLFKYRGAGSRGGLRNPYPIHFLWMLHVLRSWLDNRRIGVRFSAGDEDSYSPLSTDVLCGPHSLLSTWYQGGFFTWNKAAGASSCNSP
jgi:hypothetical protein